VFDKEINFKTVVKDLKATVNDYEQTSFYDLRIHSNGDYVSNIDNGSYNIVMFDYSGNPVTVYKDPDQRGFNSLVMIGTT